MRHFRTFPVIFAACCAGIIVAATVVNLPPPYATPSSNNHPVVIAKPGDAQLRVPSGFHVSVWAEGFEMPRFMLQGNHGELLVSDSGGSARSAAAGHARTGGNDGKIYVFPAADASRRKTLLSGLDRPYGLALWGNYLYVGEANSVKRYPYDASAFTAGKGQEVISFKGFDRGHWTRSLLFDSTGSKLYVGVGSAENVDTGEDARRAAINRYNPDGSGHEIFASGTRNPIGLHWYPGSNTLWAAVQERDDLGDDLVPDYFTHIEQGAFYGWPYAYIGPHKDPRIPDPHNMVAKTVVPDVLLGSHVAVLDFAFYTGQQFPAEYRGGAFLALHGSWNRSARVGYEVSFVPFRNGKPDGQPRAFLTGWMISPKSKDVWGRPVAVFEMKDGSLLVSDDGGKKIWKVSYEANPIQRSSSR